MRITLSMLAALVVAAAVAVPSLAAPAQTVRVTETSYRITLSAKPRAGLVTFVVRNASEDGHDFWLRGGGKTVRTRGLGEGGTARLTTRLKQGVRYVYWCGIGSHAEKGMRGTFVAR